MKKLNVFTHSLGVVLFLLLVITVVTFGYAMSSIDKSVITPFVKSMGQPYVIYAAFFIMIPWGLIRFLSATNAWFRFFYLVVFISGLLLSLSILIAYSDFI